MHLIPRIAIFLFFRQGQGDAVLDLRNSKVPAVKSVPGLQFQGATFLHEEQLHTCLELIPNRRNVALPIGYGADVHRSALVERYPESATYSQSRALGYAAIGIEPTREALRGLKTNALARRRMPSVMGARIFVVSRAYLRRRRDTSAGAPL